MIKLELSVKTGAPLTSVLHHLRTSELPAISARAEQLRASNPYISLHFLESLNATLGRIRAALNNVDVARLATVDKMSPIAFGYVKVFCYHHSARFEDKVWRDLDAPRGCDNGVWAARGVYGCVRDVKGSVDEMWTEGAGERGGVEGLRRNVMGDKEYYERTRTDEFYEDLEGEDEGKREEAEKIADSYAETDGGVVVELLGLIRVVRESLKAGVVKIKEIGGKIDEGGGDEGEVRALGEKFKEGEKLALIVRDKAGECVIQCYPQMLEVDEDGGLVEAVKEVEKAMEMWWAWGGMKGARGIWNDRKTKWVEAMKRAREVQEEYS
ncbi:hypothetical protein TrRE_jg9023 [Triparma retinervis]|uniref:Uncharacterized protein n=1 Tax=Triparma retinervis TaxID=2557542 RepID=A0A9W7KTC8_9STRA|nr:hypothetical protein TrRE_jg9023 [Triparma retinervis]